MDPQKSNMTVLAQIVKCIPQKIIDPLAKKHKIQTRAFSPTSHVVTLLYGHLAHSLSLNDVCDSLQHHAGMLSQIRRCTPPTRNGLSYANRTRNADMAEELFWRVYNDLKNGYPAFFTSSRNWYIHAREATADTDRETRPSQLSRNPAGRLSWNQTAKETRHDRQQRTGTVRRRTEKGKETLI